MAASGDATQPAFLEFNNHFLNQIILHCIYNDGFLKRVRNQISLNVFKTRERKAIVDIAYQYWDQYHKAPGDHFLDLFEEHAESMDADLRTRCLDLIDVLAEITGSNPEYISNRIKDALMHYQMEEAIVKSASLVKKGNYEEVRSIVLNALREPKDFKSPCYDFFKDQTYIQHRVNPDTRYQMQSGIDVLDNAIGGFREKWLVTLLAATKGGKTWWLIEQALQGAFQGLNVLFVSLEMGKEQIDERADMVIGFMSSDPSGKPIKVMRKVNGVYQPIECFVDNIYEIEKVARNRRIFKKASGRGSLKVMAFDSGRVNYKDIDALLDLEEEQNGWHCHLLVVDYLGIMKETASGQSKKERISENALGLKEMSGRRLLTTLSGMQGNRKAMTAEVFHSYLVADDIDTIFISDLVLAFCQTPAEELRNMYRLYIANFRHGKQKAMFGLYRDLNIGQICVGTFEIKEKPKDENMEAGADF